MHVAYFYDMPLPTRYAAAIQILQTCRELAEQDVPTTVFVRRMEGSAAECLRRYGLQTHPLLSIRPLFGTPLYKLRPNLALRRTIGSFQTAEPHFLLSRGECGIQLYSRLRRLGLRANQHWVYEAHRLCAGFTEESGVSKSEGHLQLSSGSVRDLERQAIEEAKGLVCLTPAVQEALSGLYALPSNVLILPSGTTVPAAEPSGDALRDLDILYSGKLERRKGVGDLIRSMPHLPEYHAHLAGGSPAEVEDLRLEIRRCGVESRVHLLGFLDPSQAELLYARARVGVCPLPAGRSMVSELFTSPLKLLNMMAWGVPVVATDVPSVRRIVEHNVSALLVPPGDSHALANAVRELLTNRRLAKTLTLAARQAVRSYSWQSRAAQLKDFLLHLQGV